MTEGGGTGVAMVPPNKEKKKEVKYIYIYIKFSSNFNHLAPSQKNVSPIFKFYDYIQ